MFKKGDYVMHGANGACLVDDVTMMDMTGSGNEREYYVLHPVDAKSSTIYSPVDQKKVNMRLVISREEARQLLDSAGSIDEVEVPSEKFREETYKEIMMACDCVRCVGLIKTLVNKRELRLAQGRKFTTVDERYLNDALSKLCRELSIALDQEPKAIESQLMEQISA